MKQLLGFLLLLLGSTCFTATAQVNYVSFETPNDAFIAAKKSHKPLLVKFYTDWCAQCKRMDQEVINLPFISSYINENFVAMQIDADSFKDYEYVEKYAIKAFPTVLVIDEDGKVLSRLIGYYGQIPLNEELQGVVRTRQATLRN